MQRLEDWQRKLPLILLAVGIVAILILRTVVGVSGTPDVAKIKLREAEEFRSFAVWAITYSALLVSITWASIAAAVIVRQYLSKSGYRLTLILSAILTVLVGIISRWLWTEQGILAIVERARGIPIRSVTLVGNALAVGGATLIIGACIALVTSAVPPQVAELRRRIAESRLLLFSAAVFLVIGVAEIHLVFQLPVAVEKTRLGVGEPEVLHHVTRSITLIAGLLYTSALLILFVPVAVVHERWIDHAWQAAPGGKHSEWLESSGLHRSIASTTVQLIAAAAPLMAALGLSPS